MQLRSFPRILSSSYSQIRKLQSKMTAPSQPDLESIIKSLPPPLDPKLHKGQAGRIGIIGGSTEYTGAPYFAAMTALRCGADLVYVFCTQDAAGPIKSYSPEIIVFPFLDDDNGYELIVPRLANLHSLIIGPGLGESVKAHSLICSIIQSIRKNERLSSSMSLVFDADGIGLLTRNKEILRDYEGPVYLTPNVNEIRKLWDAFFGAIDPDFDDHSGLQKLINRINGKATLILKGPQDKIITSEERCNCSVLGSARRIGGQGDLLSGSLGLFSHWANLHRDATVEGVSAKIMAAYSACALTRLCNNFAYQQKGRSMITSDMIDQIQKAFKACFER